MAVAFPVEPTSPSVPELTNQNCLSIEEARNSIKAKFISYRQLLDKKELELLSELNTIEETNKPELTQVQHDLEKLNGVLKNLDDSLGANTLKLFLEEQKVLLNKQISHFQRCENFLSHLSLETSSLEYAVANIVKIVPFISKAKFREKLKPILELEPEEGEDWYLVSNSWFDEFCDSINLNDPQPNDSWEFPQRIPIYQDGIYIDDKIDSEEVKLLHSDAWHMLLGFNGFSFGSKPISRMTHYNQQTGRVEVPLNPVIHTCVLGYVSENSTNNSFSIKVEVECYPSDTYQVLIHKLSDFIHLFTSHTPQVFAFDSEHTVSCDPRDMKKYSVKENQLYPLIYAPQLHFGELNTPVLRRHFPEPKAPVLRRHIPELNTPVGVNRQSILIAIPNSEGVTNIAVYQNY